MAGKETVILFLLKEVISLIDTQKENGFWAAVLINSRMEIHMKYTIIILFVILVVISWGNIMISIHNDKSSYEQCIKEGNAYEEDEVYVKALNSYQSALQYDENNKKLEKKIMQIYYDIGDFDSYCSYNLQMIKKYPSDTEFYLNLLTYYKENSRKKLIQFLYTIPDKLQEDKDIQSYFQYAKSLYDLQYIGTDDMTDFLFGYSRVTKNVRKENGETVEIQYLFGRDGTLLFDQEFYRSVSPVGNAAQYLVQKEDGTWQIINSSGYVLAQRKNKKFESISPFTYLYTKAVSDGKPCYITSEFKSADMSAYSSVSGFSGDGYAAVEKDGKYALMDARLALLSEFQYEDVKQDDFGRVFMNERFLVKENGKYYFVNNKNEKVSETAFDDGKVFSDTQPTAVKVGDLWGFANSSGEMYLECQYEDAKPYTNGYAAVKQNGKWGYIDANGTFVIEPQFQEAGNMTKQGTSLVKMNLEEFLSMQEEGEAAEKEEMEEDAYFLLSYDYLASQPDLDE